EYRGLTVQQLSDLRKQLRAVSAEYKVIKNRLTRLAIKSSRLEELGAHLTGPTGVVFSKEDPVALAKALHAFAKTNQALAIKAGYLEGQMLPPAEPRALADLPSREQLRGPRRWAQPQRRRRRSSTSSSRPLARRRSRSSRSSAS